MYQGSPPQQDDDICMTKNLEKQIAEEIARSDQGSSENIPPEYSVEAEIDRELADATEQEEQEHATPPGSDEDSDEGLNSLAEDAQVWEAVLQGELQESMEAHTAEPEEEPAPQRSSLMARRMRDMCSAWGGDTFNTTADKEEDEEASCWDRCIAEDAATACEIEDARTAMERSSVGEAYIEHEIDREFIDAQDREEEEGRDGGAQHAARQRPMRPESSAAMDEDQAEAIEQQIADNVSRELAEHE